MYMYRKIILFLLLHMYLLFETLPGWLACWRVFNYFFFNFFVGRWVGGREGEGGGDLINQYYLVPYTDLYAAEGIWAFQTLLLFYYVLTSSMEPVMRLLGFAAILWDNVCAKLMRWNNIIRVVHVLVSYHKDELSKKLCCFTRMT